MEGSRYRSQFRYHERFGYWFRSNLRIRIPGDDRGGILSYVIETNSVGARCRHEPLPKHSERKRVLLIGCSMSAGDRVSNKNRFSDLLEENLGWLECHNYALSGSGNDQQHLVHEEFSPAVEPDILVLSPYTGCIGRNLANQKQTYDPLTDSVVTRPKPYYLIEDGKLVLCNIPVPRRATAQVFETKNAQPRNRPVVFNPRRLALAARRWLQNVGSSGRAPHHPEYAMPGHPARELARALLLATLRASVAKRKLLVPIPAPTEAVDPGRARYHSFFSQVADEGEAEYVNPIDHFSGLSKTDRMRLYFPHDGHLTEYGHDAIQRVLKPVFDRLAATL